MSAQRDFAAVRQSDPEPLIDGMRKTIVDTLATVIFFTFVASLTELFVAGMEPGEVLKTRLTMIPLMLFTGRPYGLWRDWFFSTTKPTVSWSKTLIDGLAFLSFQLPVYAVVLFFVGADRSEIVLLLVSTAVLMFAVSRPFGLFLDAVRKVSGVT
ncbi:L-alanine exporter AlaE [Sulfitobacter sp. 1A12056]|uniref:L-alanine exporter AlaE n=1 Tax=Sulfitobacter sp. 1A12056 TaxID=3368592 RepID=UPI00374678E8